MEPRRNARAIERVFEHAEIDLRRAQQHGDVVERHAAGGLLQNAPGDLDRFAAFAGRGEQDHGVVGHAGYRLLGGKQASL